MRIKGIILKDKADASVFRRQVGNVIFPEKDFAAGRFYQTANQVERRALAAARRAEQTDELSVRYCKAEIIDRDNVFPFFPVAAGKFFRQIL